MCAVLPPALPLQAWCQGGWRHHRSPCPLHVHSEKMQIPQQTNYGYAQKTEKRCTRHSGFSSRLRVFFNNQKVSMEKQWNSFKSEKKVGWHGKTAKVLLMTRMNYIKKPQTNKTMIERTLPVNTVVTCQNSNLPLGSALSPPWAQLVLLSWPKTVPGLGSSGWCLSKSGGHQQDWN